jgi:molybdate transport system substrate-binding protein
VKTAAAAVAAVLAAVLSVVVGGCGGEAGAGGRLTVYAAASLTEVLERVDPDARFNFAGSDELATQIREGAPADVYASASARYSRELHGEGLVDEPRVFATNRLVVVVPADNPARIRRLEDLARAGVTVVVGAEGVPVGDYTRDALARAGREDVLANVVSREEDVRGVLGKVRLGEADAGFVYETDARAAGDEVRVVELPAAARAEVEYAVALVAATTRRAAAEAFVGRLLGEEGRRALQEAGFGLP